MPTVPIKLMDDMQLYAAFSAFRIAQRDDPKALKTSNALAYVRRLVKERQATVQATLDRMTADTAAVIAEADEFLKGLPKDFEGTPPPDTIATYGMFGSPSGTIPASNDALAIKAEGEARRKSDNANMPWLSR